MVFHEISHRSGPGKVCDERRETWSASTDALGWEAFLRKGTHRRSASTGSERTGGRCPHPAPSHRPSVVILELPVAVLDMGPLQRWGFNEGPSGLAGESLLTSLPCAASALDDSDTFDATLATALETAIRAGDLDHAWNDADPDGHYDNTWLADLYRTRGLVLQQLQGMAAYAAATPALEHLTSAGIRVIVAPVLGAARTRSLLTPALLDAVEVATVDAAPSLPSLLTSLADDAGIPRHDVAVIAGTTSVARAAMHAGLGTIWVDRNGRTRSSRYQDGVAHSYRWSNTLPVPAISDDLAAAADMLVALVGHTRR